MNRIKYIESLIKQYYYYQERISKINEEISDIWHSYFGAKSPPLSPVYGTGEDRQSKLVRIGCDKVKPLEDELEYITERVHRIAEELKLQQLDPKDKMLIELYYQKELSQGEIAKLLYYSNKSSVSRKVRKVLRKIEELQLQK